MLKSLKKLLIIVGAVVGLMSVEVPSTYAATQDSWGPHWYTPYDGTAQANWDYMLVTNLYWSQSSINSYNWSDSWEWEFRTHTLSPSAWWYESSFYSNLPDAYKEFDENDITIGSHSVQNAVAGTAYYGVFNLINWDTDPNFTMTFESEVGTDGGGYGDALPYRYEVFGYNCKINTNYSW